MTCKRKRAVTYSEKEAQDTRISPFPCLLRPLEAARTVYLVHYTEHFKRAHANKAACKKDGKRISADHTPKSLPLEAEQPKHAAIQVRSCRRTDRRQAHLASKTSTGTGAGRSCIRAINATARLSEQERHARRAQRAYRAALDGIPGPSPDRADAALKLTKRIGAPLTLELPTPVRRGNRTPADTSNENAKDDSRDESDSSGSDDSDSYSRGKERQKLRSRPPKLRASTGALALATAQSSRKAW